MSVGPRTIGTYRILEPLGQGGMGVVYRAEHLQTGQHVALKTVRLPRAWLLQSIRREIHALARIRHPGIVRILDEGVCDGLPWYAMELVPGMSMERFARATAAHAGRPGALAPTRVLPTRAVGSPHAARRARTGPSTSLRTGAPPPSRRRLARVLTLV